MIISSEKKKALDFFLSRFNGQLIGVQASFVVAEMGACVSRQSAADAQGTALLPDDRVTAIINSVFHVGKVVGLEIANSAPDIITVDFPDVRLHVLALPKRASSYVFCVVSQQSTVLGSVINAMKRGAPVLAAVLSR